MINHQPTINRLKAKITKLERDKKLLRLYLHELIEAYYRVVNQELENNELEMTDCCPCPKMKGGKYE